MDKPIQWYEPKFGEEEKKLVNEVLETGYVNEGPKTKELEKKLADYLGVKHTVLTTSGTNAIFLAVEADKRIRNLQDYEVIVPNLTMIATATAVEQANGKPILADIENDQFSIDINDVERKITPKTKAIIPVQIIGRSADMDALNSLAIQHNLIIIEDSAAALGSKSQGKYLGTFGKMGCFSLQANKIISCGQGGFVVTNDDQYYEELIRIKNFGRLSNKEVFHSKVGYNLKFNDIQAAVVLGQFEKLEQRKELIRNQWKKYHNELSPLQQIRFPKINIEEGTIPIYIEIIVNDRNNLLKFLNENNIFPRECWPPLHRNPPYANQGTDIDFPTSSMVSDKVLWLPNGPSITEEDIETVCNKIKEFYSQTQ